MPGKFEGEPRYAEHFYNLVMEGGGDDNYFNEYDQEIDVFNLGPADIVDFPELGNFDYLVIWEDDNGFVYTDKFIGFESLDSWLTEVGAYE